jgi:hypothetical protein
VTVLGKENADAGEVVNDLGGIDEHLAGQAVTVLLDGGLGVGVVDGQHHDVVTGIASALKIVS